MVTCEISGYAEFVSANLQTVEKSPALRNRLGKLKANCLAFNGKFREGLPRSGVPTRLNFRIILRDKTEPACGRQVSEDNQARETDCEQLINSTE